MSKNLQRIIKECFWEYNFTQEDIIRLASSDNFRENMFLFEKILLNSSFMFEDLKIFDFKLLKKLIESYNVPQFNQKYIFKRKNMAEVYFLNKPVVVSELKWIA